MQSGSGYTLVKLPKGGHSVHSLAHHETFHPVVGPVAEAEELYLRQLRIGERIQEQTGEFVIWDVGLGAAANALTVLRATRKLSCAVRLVSFDHTLEPLRFARQHADELPYLIGYQEHLETLLKEQGVRFTDGQQNVTWEVKVADFPTLLSQSEAQALPKPHAILFDAFSPAKNPAMWTQSLFTNLFTLLDPGRPCGLPTYSRSTMLRVTLLLAGFFVGVGQAIAEKEETTLAANTLELINEPLNLRWLERARRSTSAEPLSQPIYRQAPLSPETWEKLRQHPSFLARKAFCAKLAEMEAPVSFDTLLSGTDPVLALAPMQDVTDLPFWGLMARYGGADLYFTEYFRVYPTSLPEKHILKSITENPTGRPVIAQLIGHDIPALVRTARQLQQYPIAAVDLNLGCPAPVVYRKCAGGGLLREPQRVDEILGALRDAVKIRFTVKTRVGFDSAAVFPELLPIFAKHSLDLLTVHGRTVKEMYRSEVHYELIAQAVRAVGCPVLANGNVYSAEKADQVLELTGARGLMIGRGAIRNPWLFEQIRQFRRGAPRFTPRGTDVLDYVTALYEAVCSPLVRESAQVQKMKKYMNYLGVGVEPSGDFLHQIRRAATKAEFFGICTEHLAHDRPMPLEPYGLALKDTDLMAGMQL